MDIFEKLNKTFAGWYENLFGDSVSDLRPKDILRLIIGAMEDNRKEGLDNKVYVPNKYVLEIAFESDDEREYLLAFLDKDELETALRKYMAQNKYYLRGQLDFTIEEIVREEGGSAPEKLKVKCRWDTQHPVREPEPAPEPVKIEWGEDAGARVSPPDAVEARLAPPGEDEDFTVAATDMYDASTVAPPILEVSQVDGSAMQFALAKPMVTIGRSSHAGNDLVVNKDGMVSKRHAQITLGADGFTITDMNSTNGVWVNGERIDSRVLQEGDLIKLGATELVFRESTRSAIKSQISAVASRARPRLIEPHGEEFLLASEMVVGRVLTSDIRLGDPTVSNTHAKVFSNDGTEFYIEDLGSQIGTTVNGVQVIRGSAVRLNPGDQIKLGEVTLRYERD